MATETQETSFTLVYQHLKLAVAVQWKECPRSNKALYDLLLGSFVQPKAGDESLHAFKFWTASKATQALEPYKAFWNIVAIKAKQHLISKAHFLKTMEAHFKAASQR